MNYFLDDTNYIKRYIIITIACIILISAFAYWYFPFISRMGNSGNTLQEIKKVNQSTQITDEQKFAILESTSSAPVNIVSTSTKNKILDETTKGTKPTVKLTSEEIMEIMNKTK